MNNNCATSNNVINDYSGDYDTEEALIMMNNDFYNDDLYNFKEKFNLNSRKSSREQAGKNGNMHAGEEEFGYEEYDNDFVDGGAANGVEDDDYDDNNDFKTGPLANPHFNEFDDEDNEQNMIMMDTFFKRVDSMELSKPKKAKVINNYLIGELLGDGSYGKVKECLDMSTLARRAVKIINLKMVARKIPHGVENVRKEISIMKRLSHKNVIKLYSTFEKGGEAPQQLPNEDELLATTAAMINNLDKPPKIYIFMDYCMTSLEKLLKNSTYLNNKMSDANVTNQTIDQQQRLCNYQANFYFKQLIDGLEYLHSLNIIHNDIKPGNLLLTCDDILKICDFSISAELSLFLEDEYIKNRKNSGDDLNTDNAETDDDYYNSKFNNIQRDSNNYVNPNLLDGRKRKKARFPILQCTPMFQCPEMLDEDIDELMILRNASKIDIWSSGITLYQLTTGCLPFQGQTIHQIYENIRNNTIEIPKYIDKNLNNLLNGMLTKNIQQRWSIKQIRDSEWFKKKHPIVKEDLTSLPQEVIQNEYSTFRMINYLDKYCQSKAEETYNQQPYINPADIQHENSVNQFSDKSPIAKNMSSEYFTNATTAELKNNSKHSFSNHNNQNSSNLASPPLTVSAHTIPNHHNPTLQTQNYLTISQKETKKYNQATKMKRSHCDLM